MDEEMGRLPTAEAVRLLTQSPLEPLETEAVVYRALWHANYADPEGYIAHISGPVSELPRLARYLAAGYSLETQALVLGRLTRYGCACTIRTMYGLGIFDQVVALFIMESARSKHIAGLCIELFHIAVTQGDWYFYTAYLREHVKAYHWKACLPTPQKDTLLRLVYQHQPLCFLGCCWCRHHLGGRERGVMMYNKEE